MKRLSTWDTYVAEADNSEDRRVEFPLTDDEVFVLEYPTRRQGRKIAEAQRNFDTDALVIALMGEEVGRRVIELAEDKPAYVLDELLLDVMRKFGMVPESVNLATLAGTMSEDEAEPPAPLSLAVNGHNGATAGKSSEAVVAKRSTRTRKSSGTARSSTTASRRSSAASS